MKLAVAAGLVSLCAASNAQLFDNGGPNQQIGYAIVPDKSADGFNLGANSTISSVEFWDLQQSTAVLDGNISWTIYSNVYDSNSAMNLPGSALAFGDTITARHLAGLGILLVGLWFMTRRDSAPAVAARSPQL